MSQHSLPRFARCPQLMPQETGQSYIGRLTSFFGCRNPREFCLDFDLDLRGIHHGNPEALKALAQISGSNLDDLIRWTPRRIDRHYMVLNGQILHTRVNPRHVVSICPECAKADIAAHPNIGWDQVVYGRAEWVLGVVDCCSVHGVKLVSRRGPMLDAVRLDVGYETTTLLESLGQIAVEPSPPDAFQLYVLDRVVHGGVGRPAPLLDPMSLLLVSQICLAAGYDVVRKAGLKTATHRERRAAGFELFSRDIEWFETRFIEMRQGIRISHMVNSLFGRLMEYFHQERFDDPGRNGFLDDVTDVIFRNLPYPAGQVLLGRTCPRRFLHTWSSAMSTYDLGSHHLRAFIKGTPELVAYVGARPQDALIRADVADRLFLGRTPFINGSEVARRLGRKPQVAMKDLAMLVDAAVLQYEPGANLSVSKAFFSAHQVDKAITGILSRCRAMVTEENGMVTTFLASASLGIPYNVLWRLVGSGSIAAMGLMPSDSLSKGLRISLAETLSIISGVKNPMLATEVLSFLKVDRHILRLLVEDGKLSTRTAKPEFESRLLYVFDRNEIEEFHRTYISLRNLRRGMLPRLSKVALLASGLVPAINIKSNLPAPAGAIFYKRTDLA